MTYAAAHTAIRERFETQWALAFDPSPAPSVQYPNVEFEAPNLDAWVRLNIAQADAEWASLGDPGNNVQRSRGQVTAQIFVPSGEGEGLALEYADVIRGIFREWRNASAGLRFLVPPYARQIGIDGKWYQVNVVAPFEFDDYT